MLIKTHRLRADTHARRVLVDLCDRFIDINSTKVSYLEELQEAHKALILIFLRQNFKVSIRQA